MTSMLAKKAGMKLFSQNIQQYTPVDPLYETYVDDRGRERRRKVCDAAPRLLCGDSILITRGVSSVISLLACPSVTSGF
jgi:hypothetical protein